MRWTPYLDECLRLLLENADSSEDTSSDLFLVQIIRIQLIIEKIAQAPWHDPSFGAAEIPPQFFIHALEAQLENTRKEIPPALAKNGTLTCPNILVAFTDS